MSNALAAALPNQLGREVCGQILGTWSSMVPAGLIKHPCEEN
jgi:hypothetical protein